MSSTITICVEVATVSSAVVAGANSLMENGGTLDVVSGGTISDFITISGGESHQRGQGWRGTESRDHFRWHYSRRPWRHEVAPSAETTTVRPELITVPLPHLRG
jgi:hypothetical protein